MNRISLLILTISLTLLSCEQKKDTSMSFENKKMQTWQDYYSTPNIWYKIQGDISIDTLNLYNGEKSIKLTPSQKDSIKKIELSYYFDFSEIERNTITISGKYKVKMTKDAKLSFILSQFSNEHTMDSIIIEPSNDTNWKNFEIKAPFSNEAGSSLFHIKGEGDIELFINNCQTRIDNQPLSDLIDRKFAAEEDNKFENSSNIDLGKLTPQMTENLEVLGKVWGFLKYYHPDVTQGKYDWDYELFCILPKIANAENKEKRNELLYKWIDKYGTVKETADYTIQDSTKYSRFINLDWLKDKKIFYERLISTLESIKNAKRSKKLNYYTIPHKLFGHERYSNREKLYSGIKWSDQGFRILTLFRLWNVIEYCFPYTHYTDTPWNILLKDFIPKFVSAKNQASYELAILELGAKIDDSHGYITIPYNKLSETLMAPMHRKMQAGVELMLSEEDYIVVKSSECEYFNRGDIILSIGGKNINNIIEEIKPYVISSNKNGLVRNILPHLLSSDTNLLKVEILRDRKKILVEMKHFKRNNQRVGIKSWKEYNLDKKNIIHVDNIKSAEENRDIIKNNMESKGLIIDMRRYPGKDNMKYVPELTLAKYPLWISINDKSYPGNYLVIPGYDKINEPEKMPNYKGKIVILVDENTQSAGETWAMSYRLAPNSIIIGKQTAGANGNIGRTYLPGSILFQYTQLGAYYPNWEKLQRKGVKIDVPVSPTVEDIKQGRDVWIEKAIEIIENR